jgi:hypothetical protein
MLTIILHHDQSKTLDEIIAHLKKTGFFRDFPPEGTELVFGVDVMSYGLIIQVRVEVDKLRTLNRYIAQRAYGVYRCEVYPSYDFVPILAQLKKDHA